jgi:hypothetical protein
MIQQTRRDFLKKSSLGLAGLALSSNDWLNSATKPFMKYH